MKSFKRWLPFVVIILVMIYSFFSFLVFGENEPYFPKTINPKIIYSEACAQCHGERGEGSGILYPAFDSEDLTLELIRQNIEEGTWRMPKFSHIQGDTLNKLIEFIYKNEYLNN